ncbi:TPA: hypothetical protein SIE67_004089 [Escherichia coli]|nr:hypothetical protein [Escherichia coli]
MMAKAKLIIILLLTGIAIGSLSFGAGYLKGWYAHSDKVNLDAAKRKQNAENKQAKSTAQSQQVRVVTETKYKTIYRDVVKYVSDPNRTICTFDDNYIRLRQSTLNADSAVSRNAGGGVRIIKSGTEKQR